ncbi:MAG TPA: hypothetical protein P5534_06905 [Candidatus Paceibacterota bacterium]|nr:hypothetical protein [Candidatus Paceibacterota bacterium]HRZ54543.1 hypothetical protein [Candidatus Paceibacterota bacterium]
MVAERPSSQKDAKKREDPYSALPRRGLLCTSKREADEEYDYDYDYEWV